MSGANETLNTEKSFRVVIRLCALNRPEHTNPLDESRTSIQVTDRNKVVVDTGKNHKPHITGFDAVLDEESSQKDVYESTTKSLVEYLMQGYNGCVIIYGSPGSGKTHTMQGSSVSSKHRGIISRAAEDIFTCIKPLHKRSCVQCYYAPTAPKASHCKIKVSFYHIFNEKIFDLLDPKGSEVFWMRDCEEVVRLDGLTEMEVSSRQDLLQVHRRGSALRHTGISKGEFPSRSHAVFNIVVINTMAQSPGGVLTASKLTLVDLASSGKCRNSASPGVKRTINTSNDNPQEAKMLKRSLTIFGNVIFALSSVGCQHVPYRESKLTRALRDCLGGNCRTCLVVTVSSQLPLTETLSSLQFASRAMAVPSRPIHTSQLNYTPEQMCSSYLNGKKEVNHLNIQQVLPPVGSDRRSQTCSLPILLSSCSPSDPKPSSSHCGEILEVRSFLPQLEKPGQTELGGHYSRGSRPVDERNKADARLTRSLFRCLSGAVPHDTGGREKHVKELEFSPGPRHSVERLSMTSLEPSVASSTAVECPNCSRERKIREEYDKIIVQARRDKDALSQKLLELENELKRRGKEERDDEATRENKLNGLTRKAGPNSRTSDVSEGLKTAEVCVQTEARGLRADLCESREREKFLTETLHSERQRTTQDTQELYVQLNRVQEQNNQLMSTLHKQRENLLAELNSSREEVEKLQENASLTINQLRTEKGELMSHLEDTKSTYEKVCMENSSLRQKMKSFLREINSAPFSGSSGADTDTHMHTVTTNSEMIVVSHHVTQQCPASPMQGSQCCFSQFQHPEMESETTNSSDCERHLYKPQNLYKQLRREHSLLLDVMLVLYRREWFLQDAIPYVRRTLRKCGLKTEDIE